MKEWMAYEFRMKTTRSENFKTPVYERRFRLNIFRKLDEDQQEKYEEEKNTLSGKGKRQSRISGDDLVTKLKNNEINPNNVG